MIKISKFYEKFLLRASSRWKSGLFWLSRPLFMCFVIRSKFGPFRPKISQICGGDPNFLLVPQTLPTHRYSKLPLFLLEDFVSFLAWVKISIETCVIGVPVVLQPHFCHFVILTNVIYSALHYHSLMPEVNQAYPHQEMIETRYIQDQNKIYSKSSQNLVFLVKYQDSNFHLFEFISMVQRGRYSIITRSSILDCTNVSHG